MKIRDPAVSVVLVGYSEPVELLCSAAESLRRQSLAPAQIVVVDQSGDGRFERAFAELDPAVEVIAVGENLGYPSACKRGAEKATGDYLLLLNPDARADPHCLEQLVQVCEAHPRVAIAGAQVVFPDRLRVNAGDNPLHVSGISWSGRYGETPESGPPREVAVVSGAALLVRRSAWEELGGYTERFFMYYDDVDLAWRAWLTGWRVMFCPSAVVEHDYEFRKGAAKWRCLERNRWWCVLAHYRASTLLVLAPVLLATELAVWRYAAGEGWLAEKRAAWRALWTDRGLLRRRRREIQANRVRGDRDVIQRMTFTVDTPLLGNSTRRVSLLLGGYRRIVLACTR
jgi:GT2 family glycosyltransferase